MTRSILFLAFMATSAAFAANGQVYKWTDAQGVVHYSDAPPPNTQLNVQTMRVAGGVSTPASAATTDPNAPAQPQPSQTQVAQNAPAPANDHAHDCANARSNLELLQSKFQVSVTDSAGKTVALDDKARQAQVADMNAQIAAYCK
ncbi:MAG TPA: DUF4124 domain-containing protein [Rudaea sp.]|jgi:hypothetical protein|nr:DUF4124 domain-containing protein [Rudaea sp.]